MDYNDILQLLIAICPTVSLVVSTLGGVIALVKTIKQVRRESDNKLRVALDEVAKQRKQIDKLLSKVNSIESVLIEEKERRR